MRWLLYSAVLSVGLLSGCSSLTFDLSTVPFPVSASPVGDAGVRHEPFEIEAKRVLWVHGLFGDDQPDVAALLREHAEGCDGIANFRVEVGPSGHDWFLTHLTLSLVRLKTITIRGERIYR